MSVIGNTRKSGDYTKRMLQAKPQDHRIHRSAADLYRQNGDYDKAAEHYLKAINLTSDPDERAECRSWLAMTYRDMGDYQRAIEVYDTLLANPATPARKRLARGYRQSCIVKLNGYPAAAEDAKRHVAELERTRSELLEGVDAVGTSKQKRGVAELEEELAHAYKLLAQSYNKQGDSAKKIDALKRQLDLLPEDKKEERLGLMQYLTTVSGNAGDFDHAVMFAEQAVEEDPNVFRRLDQLAHTYSRGERHSKAAETYGKMIELADNPDDVRKSRLGLARAYSGMEDYDSAEKIYKQLIDDGSPKIIERAAAERAALWERLAILQFKEKNVEQATLYAKRAVEAFEKLIEVGEDPQMVPKSRFSLAMVHMRMEDYDSAERVFKQILEDDRGGPVWKNARQMLMILYSSEGMVEAMLDMIEGEPFGSFKSAILQFSSSGDWDKAAELLRYPFPITTQDLQSCVDLGKTLNWWMPVFTEPVISLHERVIETAPDSPHAATAAAEIARIREYVESHKAGGRRRSSSSKRKRSQ